METTKEDKIIKNQFVIGDERLISEILNVIIKFQQKYRERPRSMHLRLGIRAYHYLTCQGNLLSDKDTDILVIVGEKIPVETVWSHDPNWVEITFQRW